MNLPAPQQVGLRARRSPEDALLELEIVARKTRDASSAAARSPKKKRESGVLGLRFWVFGLRV